VTPLKTAVVLLVAVVVQLTVFVDVRVFGVAPELLLLLAVLAGVIAGPERGATVAFAAGLLWDVWLPSPLGLAAIVFAVVAFVAGSAGEGMFHDSRTQLVALAALGSAAGMVGYALLGEVVGERGLVDLELVRVAVIVGIVNGLLALPVAPLMRWALRRGDRSARVTVRP
jgi:rod shape-determining protein MreD